MLSPALGMSVLAEAAAEDGGSGFFLGEDLLAYLLLAFGAAMLVGNLMALYRPPHRPGEDAQRAPVGRSLAMAALGAVAALWALASLLSG